MYTSDLIDFRFGDAPAIPMVPPSGRYWRKPDDSQDDMCPVHQPNIDGSGTAAELEPELY